MSRIMHFIIQCPAARSACVRSRVAKKRVVIADPKSFQYGKMELSDETRASRSQRALTGRSTGDHLFLHLYVCLFANGFSRGIDVARKSTGERDRSYPPAVAGTTLRMILFADTTVVGMYTANMPSCQCWVNSSAELIDIYFRSWTKRHEREPGI